MDVRAIQARLWEALCSLGLLSRFGAVVFVENHEVDNCVDVSVGWTGDAHEHGVHDLWYTYLCFSFV